MMKAKESMMKIKEYRNAPVLFIKRLSD